MHYYKRNIGDYAKKAGRLSILQHGVYNLLIDACYDREEFPTEEQAIDWVWASTEEEITAVKFVLRKFFTEDSDGRFVQKRIAEEVKGYYKAKKLHWGNSLTKTERCHSEAKRRAVKLNAAPAWLTDLQLEEIKAFYEESRYKTNLTGIPHEVDHIVPLQGVNVCGLHVPWNLRVVPGWVNRQKSNRWAA